MNIDLPESDKLFILDLLNRFKQVDQIQYINQGGCAIVAHASYQFVMKHAPHLEPQIVYLLQSHRLSNIHNISNRIPDSCAHAVLCLKGKYYFDSNGLIASSLSELNLSINWSYSIEAKHVDPDFCLTSIRTPTVSWNKNFSRRPALPTIKSIFESKQNYFYKHCA